MSISAKEAQCGLLLGSFVLMSLLGCTPAALEAPGSEYSRTAIIRNGQVIGEYERFVDALESGHRVTKRQTMRFGAMNGPQRTIIDEESRTVGPEGKTTELLHRFRVGRYEMETTARIADGMAVVTRYIPAEVREVSVQLPDDIQFDNGAALLGTWDPEQESTLEFSALDIRAPLVERVTYSFDERSGPNETRTLLRKSYFGDELRSFARIYVDDRGDLIRSEQAMVGSGLETDAQSDANIVSSNPVRAGLIKSPYRMSRESMNGHIRYTFSFAPDVEFLPPETSEQRVRATTGGFVLDICQDCGPGMDDSAEALAEASQPTFWLQSDHRRIARIAEPVFDLDIPDNEKMTRLARWARHRMSEVDFAGHYSAAEAVGRRSGDCTEDAVVLAALGRAAGIPTRVASGIVYSRERYHGVSHAFSPHTWTLAYVDGKWTSFDISLQGFDATHIALTISDGDPGSIQAGHNLAGLLQWDAMTEIRKRPPSNSD